MVAGCARFGVTPYSLSSCVSLRDNRIPLFSGDDVKGLTLSGDMNSVVYSWKDIRKSLYLRQFDGHIVE